MLMVDAAGPSVFSTDPFRAGGVAVPFSKIGTALPLPDDLVEFRGGAVFRIYSVDFGRQVIYVTPEPAPTEA